jgi:hypothetical protein
MSILWAFLLILILGISFYFWPRDQRSFRTVVTTGVILGAITGIGILIARAIPVTRKETVVKEVVEKRVKPPEIVYKDRVVFRVPGKEYDPVDVKAVCSGKLPIEIKALSVSGKDDDKTTWIDGTLVGGKVLFTCGQPGDYSTWKVGDVVQITRGVPQ